MVGRLWHRCCLNRLLLDWTVTVAAGGLFLLAFSQPLRLVLVAAQFRRGGCLLLPARLVGGHDPRFVAPRAAHSNQRAQQAPACTETNRI